MGDNSSLTRFFTLHFLLPFLIAAIRGLHLFFLHLRGSNNPLGLGQNSDKLKFNPYFTWKDILGLDFWEIQKILSKLTLILHLFTSNLNGIFSLLTQFYVESLINSSIGKSKIFIPLNKLFF